MTALSTQPLSIDGVEVHGVALEGVNFTMVNVHEGYDQAFNQWYESDHFYAGGVLVPGCLSGRRWYASKALRGARIIDPASPYTDPDLGTNLATYFVTAGGLDSFNKYMNPRLRILRAAGRMFAERTHINTDSYRLENVLSFDGASMVPPHVAGDHPFAGLVATYLDPVRPFADTAGTLPAGTLALAFRPKQGSFDASSLGLRTGQCGMQYPRIGPEPVRLVLALVTEAPTAETSWTAGIASAAGALTNSTPLWTGAFLPVIPGSDAHLASIRA
jgi:hypothetical protein